MPYATEIRRGKIKKFITFLKENRDDIAAQELDEILEEIAEEQKQLVPKAEFRELVLEMKQGFERMDKRFEAIDKRLEELLHYMEKRFEDVNKRFEDVNKRFEDVNKRFEDINKRFEDVNKRFEDIHQSFSFFKWFLSIFITVLFSLNSLFFYLSQDKNQKIYELLLETLSETKNKK